MTNLRIEKTLCPYDCPSTCGLLVRIQDGQVVGVTNDPEHPVSAKLICNKMRHYERSIHSTERILTPMKRNGPKGSGVFVPCSWEEAIQIITDRWKDLCRDYGPESILPCVYSGVMSDIQRNCGDAFFNRMGASVLVKTLCSSAKGAGYKSVLGTTGCLDPRELKDSDFYLIWGSDLTATRLQTLAELQRRTGIQYDEADNLRSRHREAGDCGNNKTVKKRMVLIDTYANPTARYCDETIVVRPGTDGALALSLMHVLMKEGLADEEWLRGNGEGYETFRQTLPGYTPDWAEAITGVPAETIRRLARAYAAASAPAVILGSGNSRHKNGGMTVRLIVLFSHFTGAWKRPGGGLCGCTPVSGSYVDMSRINRPDFRKRPARRININQIASALAQKDADAVRSLYVYGCNPVDSVSNQNGMIRGLMREDLFTVVHERFMTDTARYADIILPATFSVEQNDIYRAYGYCTLGAAKKLISPPGECKSNWDTFCLLAQGMGYTEEFFSMTEEEILSDILAHPTAAVQQLSAADRQRLADGGSVSMPFSDHCDIRTSDGKIHFYDESCPIPLAAYVPPEESSYPLHLIAAPDVESVNTIFFDREELMQHRGEMQIMIHPETAKKYQITDGDFVLVYNDLGEVQFRACIEAQVAENAIVARGIWPMQMAGGPAFEALTHEDLSDIGEATTLNENRVDIRRA